MERSFQFVFKGARGDSVLRASTIQNELWFLYDDLYYALCFNESDHLSFLGNIYLSADEKRLMDTKIFPDASRPMTGEAANINSRNTAVCVNTLAVYKLSYRADKQHGKAFRHFFERTVLRTIKYSTGRPTRLESFLTKIDLSLYKIGVRISR